VDGILTALSAQQAELAGMLLTCADAAWQSESRCVGWTVADVVLHLAQTNELAIASAQDRFGRVADTISALGGGDVDPIDAAAELRVAQERDQSVPVTLRRWQESVTQLDVALRSCDPHKRVQWVAGELSARTLATTRLAETWIHTGDVAVGLGFECRPTDRLWHIARLAWRTLPYAFARAGRTLTGPVSFELQSPGGDLWAFGVDDAPITTISGLAVDLCMVAARRAESAATSLAASGPDAVAVLELVRTYA
jgi:uncharacterized protein (TIGR03084 family)